MRGSERSEDPAHLPTDRGGAPSCRPLIATCSQCSERGANHQGIAHPDTPQTPLKRAPFWGVPKSVPKRGGKKVSKKVSRMGELLNTPFFVHFFAPRDPIFGPPGGDPPFWGPSSKDKSGSGPQKGGFWGSENPPRRPPGAPGPAPGISPPGPARAPGRPPGTPPPGPPLGPPSGTPHKGTPRTPPYGTAMVVPMTWRSIGARTPCSSSRSPCGVSAARWSSTGHGDRSDLALRARPQDRHVGGRAARVVVGSDASMSPTLATGPRLSWPAATSVGVVASRPRFFPAGGIPLLPGRLTARPIGSPKAARSTIARCCRLKP